MTDRKYRIISADKDYYYVERKTKYGWFVGWGDWWYESESICKTEKEAEEYIKKRIAKDE